MTVTRSSRSQCGGACFRCVGGARGDAEGSMWLKRSRDDSGCCNDREPAGQTHCVETVWIIARPNGVTERYAAVPLAVNGLVITGAGCACPARAAPVRRGL